jgi:transglutaminase-like putative cysteine protease
MYSKILRYNQTNNRLPNYNSIKTWTNTTNNNTTPTPTPTPVPIWLQPYLQPTTNCQSTDYRITADVAAITSGITDPYAKAVALYNWLHTHEHYSFYYNSQKGAVRTLSSGYGNCCDLSNLMVAFARAAGIPAQYGHGYCHFSNNWYGHVWAQLYINGQWINADLTSSRNSFGVIKNWNTATATIYGYSITVPC